MLKTLMTASTALLVVASTAFAATFEYDIQITDISGAGELQNIGFYSTGSVGDTGTGSARTDTEFPTSVPTQLMDNSLFGVMFPGIATAASFFANPVVHDPIAGTVTVSGALGGLTGPYPDFISASQFKFIYQGVAGAPFASLGDYEDFLSSASMSGFVSATFFPDDDFEVGFTQRIDFKGATTPVPLPAGALLLLSGLGLMAIKRRKA